MKYQIKSKEVKEYIQVVKEKLELIEVLIESKKEFMNNKLVWESDTGKKARGIYQEDLNRQKAYCNSIKMFLELYEKGIDGFGASLEELKKKFKELQEENKILLKGDIDERIY